jgi:hypothetical protein
LSWILARMSLFQAGNGKDFGLAVISILVCAHANFWNLPLMPILIQSPRNVGNEELLIQISAQEKVFIIYAVYVVFSFLNPESTISATKAGDQEKRALHGDLSGADCDSIIGRIRGRAFLFAVFAACLSLYLYIIRDFSKLNSRGISMFWAASCFFITSAYYFLATLILLRRF